MVFVLSAKLVKKITSLSEPRLYDPRRGYAEQEANQIDEDPALERF